MSLLERLRHAVAPIYRVERELARGGMGIVVLGYDTRLDRPVASKILKPALATEVNARRFLHEARLMATVRHPSVVAIHDRGEAEGLLGRESALAAGDTAAACGHITRGREPGEEADSGFAPLRRRADEVAAQCR